MKSLLCVLALALVFGPFVAREPESNVHGARAEPTDPELSRLLEKAGESVVEYQRRFADIVAEETSTQRAEARAQGRVDFGGDGGGAGAAATEAVPPHPNAGHAGRPGLRAPPRGGAVDDLPGRLRSGW